MITLKESKIVCPRDGRNLFMVTRANGEGLTEHVATLCKSCDQREFFEALRSAGYIKLEEPSSQKLKS